MTKTLLLPGEYIIPEGHTAFRWGREITVRPIERKSITDLSHNGRKTWQDG